MAVINNLTDEDVKGKIKLLRSKKSIDEMDAKELVYFTHNNQSVLYTDSKRFNEEAASIDELKAMSYDRLYAFATELRTHKKHVIN
jgi:hypothetical protein